jgi:hypothetical protein
MDWRVLRMRKRKGEGEGEGISQHERKASNLYFSLIFQGVSYAQRNMAAAGGFAAGFLLGVAL